MTRKTMLASFALTTAGLLLTAYARHERHTRPRELARARLAQMDRRSGVYLLRRGADGPIGITRLGMRPMADSLVLQEETELHLPAPGGMVQEATQTSEQVLDASLRLVRFRFAVRSGTGAHAQTTRVDGVRPAGHVDSLRVTVTTGGAPRTVTVPAGPDVVFGSGVWPRLVLGGDLVAGRRIAFREFDPTALATREMSIDVGVPDTVPAERLRLDDETATGPSASPTRVRIYPITQRVGGVTYHLRLLETGLPWTATLPLGVRVEPASLNMIAAARQRWADDARLGRRNYGSTPADSTTLVVQSAIAAGHPIPKARTARLLVVRAHGVALPPDASGGVQTVSGDTVTIRYTALPALGASGYTLSPIGTQPTTLTDSQVVRYLSPEPFIESDRPEIQAAVRAAIGTERDPAVAARRIALWVYHRLTKSYTASIPSAVEVLAGGAGDCNEHTVLSTAMLRAAGIPARPVSGLVYVDGAFYFHAWVEAWLGARWVPLDPTFGLAPADPARIRLAIGMRHLNDVLRALGRLHLDVLTTQ